MRGCLPLEGSGGSIPPFLARVQQSARVVLWLHLSSNPEHCNSFLLAIEFSFEMGPLAR